MKGGLIKNNFMKNSNNKIGFWIAVIVIALIAGFVGSYLAGSITGNVVNVKNDDSAKCISDCQKDCNKLPVKDRASCKSKCTVSCPKTADVYTKAEVDEKISSAIQGLLDNIIPDEVANFNSCSVVRTSHNNQDCNAICETNYPNQRCIFGYINLDNSGDLDGSIIACGETGLQVMGNVSSRDIDTSCLCCPTL